MTLPSALQKANDEADALMAKATTKNTADDATLDDNKQREQETGTPAENKPTPEKEPQSDIDWEHKYKVLQGKFNQQSEQLKPLQEKVRQLESTAINPQQVTQLQNQITELQQRNNQLEQMAQEQSASKPQLNPYLQEEYGEEFAQAVAQSAQAQVDAVTAKFQKQLDAVNSQFQATQQSVNQTSTENRFASLRSVLKNNGINFDQVDNDPMFHEWLSEHDEYSGQPRQALLSSAFQSGDVERTARFYQAFISTQKRKPEQNPLSQHVEAPAVPGGADTGAQPAMFDPNAFEKLHDKLRRGQISQADFEQEERRLFSALNNQG